MASCCSWGRQSMKVMPVCVPHIQDNKAGQESHLGPSFGKNKLKSELNTESLQFLGTVHVLWWSDHQSALMKTGVSCQDFLIHLRHWLWGTRLHTWPLEQATPSIALISWGGKQSQRHGTVHSQSVSGRDGVCTIATLWSSYLQPLQCVTSDTGWKR